MKPNINFKLLRGALLIIAAHTLLFGVLVPQVYFRAANNPAGWQTPVKGLAIDIFTGVFVTPLILWLGYHLPIRRERFWRNLLLHLIFGFFSGGIHHFLEGSFLWTFGMLSPEKLWIYLFESPGVFFTSISTSLVQYAVIIAIQQAFFHFKESQERAFRLQEAELKMLRMQLHPHFFFNTLNAISTLILASPKDAQRMITQLGDLFRFALKNDISHEVLLQSELEALEVFLGIHKTLMGDRLKVEWRIDPQVLNAAVPHLILQPIAENAIKHGLAPLEEGGQIEISAAREDQTLVLQIRDSGEGFATTDIPAGSGIGVFNVRERLRSLYGPNQQISIETSQGGVLVELKIPYRELITEPGL